MNAILISVVGIIAVAILIYMLLKKNDIKMTLLGLGIVLMYIAILVGNKIKVSRRRQLFVGLTCKLFARMLFQLTTDV